MPKDPFREVVESGDFLILDTETTGLKRPAEIIEIAIIDNHENVLLNTRLKPARPLPHIITSITGITDSDLAECPTWLDMHERVATIICNQDVVVYNAKFDRHMLHCTDEMWDLPTRMWRQDAEQPGGLARWHCAMERYAELNGEWNEYYGDYRWVKLTDAAVMEGIAVKNAHSALGDCLMTLAVIRRMQDRGWKR